MCYVFFFFNDTATTEIYTLSLDDALPISQGVGLHVSSEGRKLNIKFIECPQGMRKGGTPMSKKNLRPLNDKIVVKRLEAEEKTKGGIFLPDNAKEKPREGKVVALGDGKLLKDGNRADFQVKKNDVVIFSSYAGTEIKVEGQEFLIMSEDDVLAIVD